MENPFEVIMKKLSELEGKIDQLTAIKPKDEVDLISGGELRTYLGISKPTEKRWRDMGKLPFSQIGSKYYYDKTHITKKFEGTRYKGRPYKNE